jgi:hypothetical protein
LSGGLDEQLATVEKIPVKKHSKSAEILPARHDEIFDFKTEHVDVVLSTKNHASTISPSSTDLADTITSVPMSIPHLLPSVTASAFLPHAYQRHSQQGAEFALIDKSSQRANKRLPLSPLFTYGALNSKRRLEHSDRFQSESMACATANLNKDVFFGSFPFINPI